MTTIDDVVNQLRAEFLEMPGLQLTSGQVRRLCGVDKTLCQLGLDSLVEMKFLYVKSDGVYARTTDGEVSRSRLERAAPASQHVSYGRHDSPTAVSPSRRARRVAGR